MLIVLSHNLHFKSKFKQLCHVFVSLTDFSLLRGIVNHSNSESQLDSDRNIVNNRLSDTNRYEVLEKYDEVENEEIGTKSTT